MKYLIFLVCFFFNLAFANPEICDRLLRILESSSTQGYIGEPVTQLEHALQCAYFAGQEVDDPEVILAALFHDIGHLCDDSQKGGFGVINHAIVGANFLRENGMSEKVCQLVLGHVEAKRYLTAIDSDYYERLSDASKTTLALQGGAMSIEEVAQFEKDPLYHLKIQMRTWDEQAKVSGLVVPPLEYYRKILLNHLRIQNLLC